MNIGILTFHRSTNYGAQLQAYALRRYLELAGHHASVIDYWPQYRQDRDRVFSPIELQELKGMEKLKFLWMRLFTCLRLLKRSRAANAFATGQLNMEESGGYDVVVYGSDQIWRKFRRRNFSGYDPVYFGRNDIATNRRITYAASMGPVAFDSDSDRLFFGQSMKQFNAISVRETGLQSMLDKEFGINAAKVCDPTLLLSSEEWMKMIDKRCIPSYPYILYYRLNPNATADRFVERLSTCKGIKVIEMRGKIPLFHYASRYRLTAGPQEFLSLLNGAQYVVSTSFHGVALSIRLQKQFYFVSAEKNANRAMSLLTDLGLQHRRVTDWRQHSMEENIDYNNSEEKLNAMIASSAQWLLAHLSDK